MRLDRVLSWLVVLCVVAAVPQLHAAWTAPVTMGATVVISDPSCASSSTGTAVCAARGLAQTLVVNQWDGTKWIGWKVVAGNVTSSPSCAATGTGDVVCAARNLTSGISATVFDGAAWGPLKNVGGQITFEPSCATLTPGSILCAARSTTGTLTSTVFNGTTWSAFKTLKGPIVSAPGCGGDGSGFVYCLATSTNLIWHVFATRFNGTAWSPFLDIGGSSITDRYHCVALGGTLGPVACFARGSNSGQFVNDFKGGAWAVSSWTGWSGLGGAVSSGTACDQVTTSQLACATVASDAALWVNSFNGTGWLGWTKSGGSQIGNPSCTSLGGDKVLCAVIGGNGKGSSVVGP